MIYVKSCIDSSILFQLKPVDDIQFLSLKQVQLSLLFYIVQQEMATITGQRQTYHYDGEMILKQQKLVWNVPYVVLLKCTQIEDSIENS